jgi:hypothetical protein
METHEPTEARELRTRPRHPAPVRARRRLTDRADRTRGGYPLYAASADSFGAEMLASRQIVSSSSTQWTVWSATDARCQARKVYATFAIGIRSACRRSKPTPNRRATGPRDREKQESSCPSHSGQSARGSRSGEWKTWRRAGPRTARSAWRDRRREDLPEEAPRRTN